jgi:hypothetical protein
VVLTGCDGGSTTDGGNPETPADVGSAIELANLLPADAALVGVTVAPDGKRYVLDQHSGLYEVGTDSARLVFNTSGLNGVQLTDVVALDANRFALTAENDGFLFDTRTTEFTSYFCYLPSLPPENPPAGTAGSGPMQPTAPVSISQTLRLEGISVQQRTDSVAFNPATRQLFAQPRTTRLDNGTVAGSELFVFGETGGQPLVVLPLADRSFVAGGMVATADNRLLLGAANGVYQSDLGGGFTLLRLLDAAIDITGMARDPSGALWLLDGAARRLIKLDSNP